MYIRHLNKSKVDMPLNKETKQNNFIYFRIVYIII